MSHVRMTIDDHSRNTCIQSLLDDTSYHIEFNGHLTNHNKHAVVALSGLGASEKRIKSYYENYAKLTPYGFGLEPTKKSKHLITTKNWENFLGKRTSFSSYCDFFNERESELGTDALLKQYVPRLLSGWVGSLTHAAIHLGFALDVQHRWMMIEGLAYMAFSYVDCHPERACFRPKSQLTHPSPIDSLIYLADQWEKNSNEMKAWVEALVENKTCASAKAIHPELERSGTQYRIAKLLAEGHPLIYALPAWTQIQPSKATWEQLYYIVTLLYLATPGDFFILHLITSLYAMEQIAKRLSKKHEKDVIICFWIGILCILFSRGELSNKNKLETLHAQFNHTSDKHEFWMSEKNWEHIIEQAIDEEEEHNPKMVYVLRKQWKKSGYLRVYRTAASYFTRTPGLPDSFEREITEDLG